MKPGENRDINCENCGIRYGGNQSKEWIVNFQLLYIHAGEIEICGKYFPGYLKSVGKIVHIR